jgi:hypothetical protein
LKWKLLCPLLLSSLLLLSSTTFADEVINWQLEALETQLKLDQAIIELQQARDEAEILKFWIQNGNRRDVKQFTKESRDVLAEYKKSLEPEEEIEEEVTEE